MATARKPAANRTTKPAKAARSTVAKAPAVAGEATNSTAAFGQDDTAVTLASFHLVER